MFVDLLLWERDEWPAYEMGKITCSPHSSVSILHMHPYIATGTLVPRQFAFCCHASEGREADKIREWCSTMETAIVVVVA